MINVKDTIVLSDNKEYLVVSKANVDDKTYYYIIDLKDNSNIKFCYENRKNEDIVLTEIEYTILSKKVLFELFKNMASVSNNN